MWFSAKQSGRSLFSPRKYVDRLDLALNLSVLLSETLNQDGKQQVCRLYTVKKQVLRRCGSLERCSVEEDRRSAGNPKHEMSFRILHTSSSKSWNEFNVSNGYVRDRSIEFGEQKGVVVECSLRCMANS